MMEMPTLNIWSLLLPYFLQIVYATFIIRKVHFKKKNMLSLSSPTSIDGSVFYSLEDSQTRNSIAQWQQTHTGIWEPVLFCFHNWHNLWTAPRPQVCALSPQQVLVPVLLLFLPLSLSRGAALELGRAAAPWVLWSTV